MALMGYLATDPELKTTTTGKNVANFKIATNRDWKSADGEKHESTDFHKVVMWEKLAEVAAKHLNKGAAVYLEGRISNNQWKDQQGQNRVSTEIIADSIHFLDYKKNKDVQEVNLVEVAA